MCMSNQKLKTKSISKSFATSAYSKITKDELDKLRELNNSEILEDTTFVPNPHEYITVRGAREHNLKNVSIVVPKNKLVVFSGLSGSGKSSLVFDTVYAEGQRRYVESLSSYARQFLGLKEKPDVDSIDGLSPSISIDQKSTSQNPRSTVGTITEIYDYLRLLYAKIGIQHCPTCNSAISTETVSQMTNRLSETYSGSTAIILAPIVEDQKGWHKQHIQEAKKAGFRRLRMDKQIMLIEEAEKVELSKQQKHTIEIVVDRITLGEDNRIRLISSLETALQNGGDKAIVIVNLDGEEKIINLNKNLACPNGHGAPAPLEPRMFSFNSPHGACTGCTGLGVVTEIDADLVVPNKTLSILEGCIKPVSRMSMSGGWLNKMFEDLAKKYNFSLDTAWMDMKQSQRDVILYGDNKFEGMIVNLKRRYKESTSEASRRDIESYMNKKVCPDCSGARLKKDALAVTIVERNISEIANLSIKKCSLWFESLYEQLNNKDKEVARLILKEISSRLRFLLNVGLEYLSIQRSADTLSGGEAQRIRLATQIGSGLTGVLYILDEPSIGLHQRDNTRLLDTLKQLRDLGNTVLVVEHDEETMREADYIVDIGPKAGKHGGYIVAQGSPDEVSENLDSPTGRYLSHREMIELPKNRRSVVFNVDNRIDLRELEKKLKEDWIDDVSYALRK